ncbi:MAG: SpoIIE family protein phosphatase [Verrucomicrobiae bacterium]|nr:SpoIIE family protein phosphatase [Verrucomicrobiae bacterium]
MNVLDFLLILLTAFFAHLWWKQRRRAAMMRHGRQHLIQERQRVLTFVHSLGDAFTENLKIEEILKVIVSCSVRTAEASSGAVFLLDEKTNELETMVVEGPFPPLHVPDAVLPPDRSSGDLEKALKGRRVRLGEGIIGGVAKDRRPLLVRHSEDDPRIPVFDDEALRVRTFLAAPLIFRNRLLGVLAMVNTLDEKPFNESDLSLVTSLANQGAFAIYNGNLYQMLAEKERMDRDLAISREIQQLLMPKKFPWIEGMEVAAFTDPALQVGGDYYGFVQVDADHWGFSIADVSGKGVSGALIMAMCRSALRTMAMGRLSPAQVLKEVNRSIFPDMREEMFISLVYGVLNTKTRQFDFCRAGHEPVLVFREGGKKVERLVPRGMALGIDNGRVFDNVLEEKRIVLKPGDAVLLYTDGITEALDEAEREFGLDRLIEAARSSMGRPALEMVSEIKAQLGRFTGHHPQDDDMTLVIIRA